MNSRETNIRERVLAGGLCVAGLAAGIAVGLWFRAPNDAELLAQRQAEVKAIGPAEKDRLRGKHARFVKLDADDQARLRQLDEELASAADCEELRGVMRRYHEWLKTLNPMQRADLLRLANDPDKRLHRVAYMAPLSKQDMDKIGAWWRERWQERWKQRPPESGKGRFAPDFGGERMSEAFRGFYHNYAVLLSERPPTANDRVKPLSLEEYDKLATGLSDVPRKALEAERTVAGKGQLVGSWLRRRFSPPERRFPNVTEQELVRYFNEELSSKDREELISLPLQERNRKLREKYNRSKSPASSRPVSGSKAPAPSERREKS